MRPGRFGLRIWMILVGIAGTTLGGTVALIDRDLWLEERWCRCLRFDPWIESPLEWVYLGALAGATASAGLAIGSRLRSRRFTGITTRHWMTAVVWIAVLLAGVEAMRHRSSCFRRIAWLHEQQRGKVLFRDLEFCLMITPEWDGISEDDKAMTRLAQPLASYVNYHYAMQSKYEVASRRPWNPVWTDPPEPRLPSAESQRALRTRYLEPMLRRLDAPSRSASVPLVSTPASN